MLFLNTPYPAEQEIFAEAAKLGASEVRLDVELSGIFENPASAQTPDWTWLDQDLALAKKYGVKILANLTATPEFEAENSDYNAPPTEAEMAMYELQVAEIAQHSVGVIDDYEVWNEPDGWWSFHGTATQYGEMLARAYAGVHARDPNGRVVLGGAMDPANDRGFFATAAAVPGANWDISNIHLRMPLGQLAAQVSWWKSAYAKPVWVTEMGYPADPSEQHYAGFQSERSSQAAYDVAAIGEMLSAGAKKVFVTERDDGASGQFATEGVLASPDPLPNGSFPVTPRPSFYAVQALINREAQPPRPAVRRRSRRDATARTTSASRPEPAALGHQPRQLRTHAINLQRPHRPSPRPLPL